MKPPLETIVIDGRTLLTLIDRALASLEPKYQVGDWDSRRKELLKISGGNQSTYQANPVLPDGRTIQGLSEAVSVEFDKLLRSIPEIRYIDLQVKEFIGTDIVYDVVEFVPFDYNTSRYT